jgi:hypothetical protein
MPSCGSPAGQGLSGTPAPLTPRRAPQHEYVRRVRLESPLAKAGQAVPRPPEPLADPGLAAPVREVALPAQGHRHSPYRSAAAPDGPQPEALEGSRSRDLWPHRPDELRVGIAGRLHLERADV